MQVTEKPNIGKEEVVIPDWLKVQPGFGEVEMPKAWWPGMQVKRHFTSPDTDPTTSIYGDVEWEISDITLPGEGGVMRCRFPKHFSEQSRKIVAAKYMKRCEVQVNNETVHDFEQLVHRILQTIFTWGIKYGYYATNEDAYTHYDELAYLLIHQYFAFNSPVWFNLGIEGIAQQCSACFILPVEDTLDGLSQWYADETKIFKRGSGSGADVSRVRSSYERLSLGGIASGPLSFMKVADCNAGQIKSGGTTRRAAKMVVMRVDHPDILVQRDGQPGFIRCKASAEKVARALIDSGYPSNFTEPGNAYSLVDYQNANHSVRITEEFMQAYEQDGKFATRYVTTGETCAEYSAREILREIAQATWECGDPGVQFDDLINRANTTPNSCWIYASNPCSEYLHQDNTSCNLASIRVTKFLRGEPGAYTFDTAGYQHTIDMMTLAMEILVAGGDFPTEDIAYWTRVYRNIGLGHCDLGALLMKLGLPYDSDEGRGVAAMLASTLTARAYVQSAQIARDCGGPFAEFGRNRISMMHVLENHNASHYNVEKMVAGVSVQHPVAFDLWNTGLQDWAKAINLGDDYGFRNANVTVEAPTGTISFLMGADTTGIEPCIGLVVYKNLVGGGVMTLANEAVDDALKALGYGDYQAKLIKDYVAEYGIVEGCIYLEAEHLPIFDCAFAPKVEGREPYRTISWQGHLKMLGAIQPFISMSISKTVNMPETATVEEIEEAYYTAWKLGVKCVAIYRDNCKRSQPLATKSSEKKEEAEHLTGLEGVLHKAAEDAVKKAYDELQEEKAQLALRVQEEICRKAEFGDLITFEQYLTSGVPEHWAKHTKEDLSRVKDPVMREVVSLYRQEQTDRIKELEGQNAALEARLSGLGQPVRRKLPDERAALTHKFSIAGHEGYVTVGLYDDGTPGELFITMSKEGSTVAGVMDAFATSVSMGLQYGVPLEKMCDKYTHMRFEPAGFTPNQDIPTAKSILDYIFRWLRLRFLDVNGDGIKVQAGDWLGYTKQPEPSKEKTLKNTIAFDLPEGRSQEDVLNAVHSAVGYTLPQEARQTLSHQLTGPECPACHAITRPAGKCYVCPDCGESTGCS